MDRTIDVDRGVVINIHPTSGMQVYMYVDDPGVYLNAYGSEVGEKLAKEAGFKVEALGKERVKRERMRTAMAAIEKEVNIEAESDRVTVAERGGFKVVSIGLGRHHVEDADGNILTSVHMPKEQAEIVLDALAPKAKVQKAKEAKEPKD